LGSEEQFERGRSRENAASGAASVDWRTSSSMRLLSERNDDCRGAIVGKKSGSNCGANQRCIHEYTTIATFVQVRYLRRHHRCGAARCQGHESV